MKIKLNSIERDIAISKLTKIILFNDIDLNRLENELSVDLEKSKKALKSLANELPIKEGLVEDSFGFFVNLYNMSRTLKSQLTGDITWNEYLTMFYVTMKVFAAIRKDKNFLQWLKSLFFVNLRAKYTSPALFFVMIYVFIRTLIGLMIHFESGKFILTNGDSNIKLSITSIGRVNKFLNDGETSYEIIERNETYEILNKSDKKIGFIVIENGEIVVKNNKGESILRESNFGVSENKPEKTINLEKTLLTPLKENVDQSKKLLKDIGIDYNDPQSTTDKKTNQIIQLVSHLKEILTESNNLGYMGLFTKLIIDSVDKNYNLYIRDIDMVFQKIKELKPVLNELRGQDLERKNIMNFDSFEELSDSLEKLHRWRIVNNFMKKIPAAQKSLIWEDGFFKRNIKSKSIILENIILELSKDLNKQQRFLKKVSAIKDQSSMINYFYQFDDRDMSFGSIIKKINDSTHAIVTYKNENQGVLICAVFSYRLLKQITPGCNWCITRDERMFDYYTTNAVQYVVYRFDKKGELLRENTAIIGITLDKDFRVKAAHNMDDTPAILPYATSQQNPLISLGILNFDMNYYAPLGIYPLNLFSTFVGNPDKFIIDMNSENLSGLKKAYKWVIVKMNTNPIISRILDIFS